jgi:hypothetical protein
MAITHRLSRLPTVIAATKRSVGSLEAGLREIEARPSTVYDIYNRWPTQSYA